jgi:hypothetical protein
MARCRAGPLRKGEKMKEEDLFPGFRVYLVERFGPEAGAATLEPIARGSADVKRGGYGVPYIVRWRGASGQRRLVLETVRPGGFGHEDRADRAALVVRAFDDGPLLPGHVRPVDAGVFRRGGAAASLRDTEEFFLLTEFCEGEPYASDFERVSRRGSLEEQDRGRAAILADYLAGIHREPVSHPTYYRRRLRDLVGSGECIAGIADSYPSGTIGDDVLLEVEKLALSWRYRLRDRPARLRVIHGDFHPWNILFQQGINFGVLDRSRGRYGDPADDVAALAVNYVFFALRTGGAFTGPFADLFRLFWDRYRDVSGDDGLEGVIAPHFAFRALVLANPLWYPDESERTRRLLFCFLFGVLEEERFAPERIPAMLSRARP